MGDAVARAAASAGFDLWGVARAADDPGRERYEEWLARGYHGDMQYMDRRPPVEALLPGCRSVIALAVNYFVPHEPPPGPRVSRYAWGEDYHRVLGRMLARLVPELEAAHPGERFLPCCDTKPVLEKAWAERAGLGWIGKNGCLISQEFGSYLFLAVVLTTAELAPDAPHPDRCGSCTRCLHACPTGAFVAPKVIDARRCIPYLTIEQWKPIPTTLPVAPWAFGCDACQEVCPWNGKAKACRRQEFAPRPGQDAPDLRAWVAMDGPEFRARFGDTALARPGRRGLARNALALLRETGLDAATRAAALADASALVRAQASDEVAGGAA
ncbi:MAG: tRNA epoxyqueuosine(34) reductase QueG [Planctomycetaceae bacterium]